MPAPSTRLLDVPLHQEVVVSAVDGPRGFRRRLLELGLIPGAVVSIHRRAPLGDPLELRLRGCRLSIRGQEAAEIAVLPVKSNSNAALGSDDN